MIDYSSSARDVPSSTPTAHCQTKRTPFFFPPPCFSPAPALAFVLAPTFHVVIDRGLYVVRARRCSPRMDAFFVFLSTAPGKGRVILQVHGASNRTHFPQTFSLRWGLRILFCPFLIRPRAWKSRNAVTQFENLFGDSFKDMISPVFCATDLSPISTLYFLKILFKPRKII